MSEHSKWKVALVLWISKKCGLKKRAAFQGKIRIDKSACDGCGVCVKKCPKNVFILKDISDEEIADLSFMGKLKVRFRRKKSYVNDYNLCISCKLCERSCHKFAIQVGEKIE
ncbi:MAG: 4Fe-4S dicluster domain-containing protein [Planctomycetaceae bacterium]|jgi:ferredoxin|nr:4Fe-4S dicluster domain-containing protein [Planctomycetaceae bacterium]